MQEIVEAIVGFVREHQSLAIPIAFLVAFGESFCFFSVLWPGTAILVGISALLAASGVGTAIVIPAITAAALGGILGYALSFWLGLYFKDSIERFWPFRSHPDLIIKGELFFRKYGAMSVFLGHFFGPVRAVIPVVAGMFAMRQLPFQVANAASSLIWSTGVIAPAFYLVTFQDEVFAFLANNQLLVAKAMFALALVAAIPYSLISVPTMVGFAGLGLLFLVATGEFWLMWLSGMAGAVAGDAIAYLQGVRRRPDLLALRFLHGNTEAVANARLRVERDGPASLIKSKSGPVARALVPMMAGALSMPLTHFVPASVLSCALWTTALLSPYLIAVAFGWVG